MRRSALAICGLGGLAAAPAAAAPVLDQSSDPYPGIHLERWTDAAVPARIHLAVIDLASSEIALIATSEIDKGITPTAFATRVGAQLAINGDFYAAATFLPRGLAVGADRVAWGLTADNPWSGALQIDRTAEDRTRIVLHPPEVALDPANLPPENQGVVSGRPLLVRAGVVQAPVCDDPITLACTRAPRTAAAVSADGNTLWLAVVDGWQAGSAGLTANELAAFLVGRGARDAIGLDVGAASAMILDGAAVSSPSEGAPRAVANHLAVKYGAQPPGQLIGIICLRDIFDCQTKIADATVTLDTGATDVTTSTGIYDFPEVPPRYACVDVTADGYEPAHKCTQVKSGMETYNSVALFPIGERPDAGPRPDARPIAAGPDAAIAAPPPGGCCAASGAADPLAAGALAAVVGFVVARRRRVAPA